MDFFKPSLRQKVNNGIAETVADIRCNPKLENNLDNPDRIIRERGNITKSLTTPITARNIRRLIGSQFSPATNADTVYYLMEDARRRRESARKLGHTLLDPDEGHPNPYWPMMHEKNQDETEGLSPLTTSRCPGPSNGYKGWSPRNARECLDLNEGYPNPFFHPDFREWRKERGIILKEDMNQAE